MCNHRTAGRWGRFWAWFTGIVLAVFTVAEAYGLVTEGSDAAYSTFIRRGIGALEPCTHSRLGRFSLVALLIWAGAHLGWGKFGISPRPRTETPCH